jgi:DNA-binding winged helix-turn-helix (wHTH) protein/class 3 adenylate cyclase
MLYIFGDYTLDPARYELRRAGVLVPVAPRAFDLLAYLMQHAGQIVPKEELFTQLWAEQFVTDSALTYCVTEVRKAIGDTGRGQRYIRTVHGRGYRFIMPVTVQPQPEAAAQRPEAPVPLPPATAPHLTQADTAGSLPTELPAPPATRSPAPGTTSPPTVDAPALTAAEWRQLTVLACQLVTETTLAVPLDSEGRLAVLRAYRQGCAAVLHRFGGALPQYDGLSLVAYFGYPQAHEDAARRAVFAGMGLVEAVATLSRQVQRDWGLSLTVQVGLHTGREVVGSLAPGDQGAPLALGDTQALATALRDSAPPDTVLLSQATFRLVETDVACAALGTHLLEANADPLGVYQVLQARTPQ